MKKIILGVIAMISVSQMLAQVNSMELTNQTNDPLAIRVANTDSRDYIVSSTTIMVQPGATVSVAPLNDASHSWMRIYARPYTLPNARRFYAMDYNPFLSIYGRTFTGYNRAVGMNVAWSSDHQVIIN